MSDRGPPGASPAAGASALAFDEAAAAPPTPTLISVDDLARRWGVDRKTVYGMIDRGELRAVRLGRLVRVPLAVVASLEQGRAVPEGK